MIYQATEKIARAFEERELRHTVDEAGPLSFVSAHFGGEHGSVQIRMISSDEDNDVKVLTANIAKFPEDKLQRGYELVNEFNNRFRYAKFGIDSDGDLTAQYDIPVRISDDNLGEVAFEIAVRIAQIVDKAYPEIMKAIWA